MIPESAISASQSMLPRGRWLISRPWRIGSFNPSTLGLIYTRVGEYLLSAQLSALQDQGKLHILSSPSITTQDNKLAFIESGQDVPYQSVEDGEVKVEYKKAVLRLEVTPNVIDGDTLKLDIKVNKDEPDFSRTVLGNPTIITKKAETNVIQNDGQTIVIGGLSKESASRNQYRHTFSGRYSRAGIFV